MTKEELVLAPSAGQCRVRSHLHWTSLWLGQQVVSTVDAACRLIVGLKIIHKTWKCTEESQRSEERKCRRQGIALTRNWLCCVVLCFVVLCGMPGGLQLYPTQTVTQCPRYQPSVQYTHKLCSHPPLPLIQCSNSTLFCNTVTQSHQLFTKDFCTCSVMGLIDTQMEVKGEEVKNSYNFPKTPIKLMFFSIAL